MTLLCAAASSLDRKASGAYGYTWLLRSYSAPGTPNATRPFYRVWGSSRGGLFVRLYREV